MPYSSQWAHPTETVFSQALPARQIDITLTSITQTIHRPLTFNFLSPTYITGPLNDLSLLYPTSRYGRRSHTCILRLFPSTSDILPCVAQSSLCIPICDVLSSLETGVEVLVGTKSVWRRTEAIYNNKELS